MTLRIALCFALIIIAASAPPTTHALGRARSGGLAFWTWACRQPRTGLPETSNRFNGGSTS